MHGSPRAMGDSLKRLCSLGFVCGLDQHGLGPPRLVLVMSCLSGNPPSHEFIE